jgi:hypothetical protein
MTNKFRVGQLVAFKPLECNLTYVALVIEIINDDTVAIEIDNAEDRVIVNVEQLSDEGLPK